MTTVELSGKEMLMTSNIHVHVDVSRRWSPFDGRIDVHVPEAFLCCFYRKLFIFVFQSDALNVKLLQREIEMYLDGSEHKR